MVAVAGSDNGSFGEPSNWFVTFHERSERQWVNRFCPGKFKHVGAFGYVAEARVWVFVDFLTARLMVRVASDRSADILIAEETAGGTVVKMPEIDKESKKYRLKPGLWCVPATAHLLGLGGSALLPDQLFRQCMANGGQMVTQNNELVQKAEN